MMNYRTMAIVVLGAYLICGLATKATVSGAEIEVLGKDVPWRVFLVCAAPVEGTAAEPKPTRSKIAGPSSLPPVGWTNPGFDDNSWGRYERDLFELSGQYGHWQSTSAALLCLRTRFGVSDPRAVKDLQLSLEYRGGVVVYVNGKEIARGHMPAGEIQPLTLAEDYPREAFFTSDGAALPRMERPASEFADHYERRIRRIKVPLSRDVLRKSANVLAVELITTCPEQTPPRGATIRMGRSGSKGFPRDRPAGDTASGPTFHVER